MERFISFCENCYKSFYNDELYGCQFGRMKKMRSFCKHCAELRLGRLLPDGFEEGYTRRGLLYYSANDKYYCEGEQVSWNVYGQYPNTDRKED